MRFWTWGEIRTKIEQECDLEDEDFVRRSELLAYCNEAIDEAEAEIHSLYEDYFLKLLKIPVTAGLEKISMSTSLPDIYGEKIRSVIYLQNGSTSPYTVRRLKDSAKFIALATSEVTTVSSDYQYFIVNQTPGNPEMQIVPPLREDGNFNIAYLRNANRLNVDADICDIPEFINFIFAHMKTKVYAKEGHPGYPEAIERLETERNRMNAVLASRTPDMDNIIEVDMSHYGDMN